VKNLVVCVLEAPLREARTSVGFTTSDFLTLDGRFTHNYFLGGARRFNVQGTVGNLASRGFYQALPQNVFQNPFKRVGGGTESAFFLPTYYAGRHAGPARRGVAAQHGRRRRVRVAPPVAGACSSTRGRARTCRSRASSPTARRCRSPTASSSTRWRRATCTSASTSACATGGRSRS
jgi:hypothetical protein